MIAFVDEYEEDTTTRPQLVDMSSLTTRTAIALVRVRGCDDIVEEIYTGRASYYSVALPEPPKNWRPWHAFGGFSEYRTARPTIARAGRPWRRQHPFPTIEAAARKRRRFLQEIRA